MSGQDASIKAFEEKVAARLQEAKSKIEGIEAHAKATAAQAEIDTIHRLKTQRQEIEKKHQDLKTSGEAKAGQLKAEIESELAKLKTSLEQFEKKAKAAAK